MNPEQFHGNHLTSTHPENATIPVTTLSGEEFHLPRSAFGNFPFDAAHIAYRINAEDQTPVEVKVYPSTNTEGLSGLSFEFHRGGVNPETAFIDDASRELLLRSGMPESIDFSVKYGLHTESDRIHKILIEDLGCRPIVLGMHQLDVYCAKAVEHKILASLPVIGRKYRTPSSVVRIRMEGGRYLLSEKDPLAAHSHSSEWQRSDVEISESYSKELFGSRALKEIARIEKTRDVYLAKDGTLVCIDDVLHHGQFIEIRGDSLGFLTTAAVVDPSFKNLFSALCAAAVCDGAGDSLAVAKSARSELNGSWKDAIGVGAKTFAGKVVMPATFLPIALYSPPQLIPVFSVAWAAVVLGAISAEQAIATARSVREEMLFTIIGALGVTGLSAGVGAMIQRFLQ